MRCRVWLKKKKKKIKATWNYCYFFFFFLSKRARVYVWICVRGGRRDRGERKSQAGSLLSAECIAGLDPMTLRSWPKQQSRGRCSNDLATQKPRNHFLLRYFFTLQKQTKSIATRNISLPLYTSVESKLLDQTSSLLNNLQRYHFAF